MITLPRWFPELDGRLSILPLCDINVCGMCRRFETRWFCITAIRFRFICWRSTWQIDAGFNLYKREER